MTKNLFELHKIAAAAEVLRIQYTSGYLTAEEFEKKINELHDHNCIPSTEGHEDKCAAYREIIDGALRIVRKNNG